MGTVRTCPGSGLLFVYVPCDGLSALTSPPGMLDTYTICPEAGMSLRRDMRTHTAPFLYLFHAVHPQTVRRLMVTCPSFAQRDGMTCVQVKRQLSPVGGTEHFLGIISLTVNQHSPRTMLYHYSLSDEETDR